MQPDGLFGPKVEAHVDATIIPLSTKSILSYSGSCRLRQSVEFAIEAHDQAGANAAAFVPHFCVVHDRGVSVFPALIGDVARHVTSLRQWRCHRSDDEMN